MLSLELVGVRAHHQHGDAEPRHTVLLHQSSVHFCHKGAISRCELGQASNRHRPGAPLHHDPEDLNDDCPRGPGPTPLLSDMVEIIRPMANDGAVICESQLGPLAMALRSMLGIDQNWLVKVGMVKASIASAEGPFSVSFGSQK